MKFADHVDHFLVLADPILMRKTQITPNQPNINALANPVQIFEVLTNLLPHVP